LRAELDLFDLDHLLVLASLTRALLLLVLVLPEIHDAADRRVGRRGDLDQVEPLLLGDGQRLRRRHDAKLCAGIVDDADFPDPDAFVDPRAVVTAGTSVESDKASLRLLPALSSQLSVSASLSSRLPRRTAERCSLRADPSARSRRAPTRRRRRSSSPLCLRPIARGPTRCRFLLRDRRRPACRGFSAAGPPGSYIQSFPAARRGRLAAPPA